MPAGNYCVHGLNIFPARLRVNREAVGSVLQPKETVLIVSR